jgi:hypothetical protein
VEGVHTVTRWITAEDPAAPLITRSDLQNFVFSSSRARGEARARKLSEGASEADLLDAYPRLTREDIQAAMRYAADTIAHREVIFIGKNSDRD